MARIPGVSGAGLTSSTPVIDPDALRPLSGTLHDGLKTEERPWAYWFGVSPGFFQAAGIRVMAGRAFEAADTADRQQVAIVNQDGRRSVFRRRAKMPSAARRRFMMPNAAIGPSRSSASSRHARQRGSAHQPADLRAAGSVAAGGGHRVRPIRRSAGARPGRPGADARRRSRGRDLRTQDDEPDCRRRAGQLRGSSTVCSSGSRSWRSRLRPRRLFGVISYSVGQRRRELGIRLALGASPAAIGRMIVGEGLRIVGLRHGDRSSPGDRARAARPRRCSSASRRPIRRRSWGSRR